MDVQDIITHTADITLDDEEQGIRFEDEEFGVQALPAAKSTWTIVGRFLTDRNLKTEVMKHVMASAWKPLMGIEITDVQANLFLFTFFDELDMRRVSDIPQGYRTAKVLERIGDYVGVFLRYDERNFERQWTSFYRVRVTHDVSNPLKRRMKMILRDGSWTWINFKYERLHMFCFFCGKMGHTDKFCLQARRSLLRPEQYPFGVSMRAGGTGPAKTLGEKWFQLGQERRREIGYGSEGGGMAVAAGVGRGGLSRVEGATATGRVGSDAGDVEGMGGEGVGGEGVGVRVDPKRRRTDRGEVNAVNGDMVVDSESFLAGPVDQTVREIEGMVSSKKPDFVFLIETKVDRDHAERLRVKLGFDGLFCTNSSGLSGGIALLWRTNNTARLISYSTNYVDVEVTMPGFEKWRMTGFYGFSQRGQRRDSWDLIRTLAGKSNLPWVMIGDFNDLLYQAEKRGGNPHPLSLLHGFGETIEECGLAQMPMMGYPFTWEKGKGTPNWIEERLDKVLTSQSWRDIVPDASVQNILTRKLDHSALFLGILNLRERMGGLRRGFRFEMAWLHDEGCRDVVEKAWDEGAGRGLQECISICGNRLSRWGGERFHKFGERIRNLRKEQLRLRGCNDPSSLAEFQRLEECLCRIEAQEDTYWRQRAKQHWLKNADANTKYYHSGDWVEGDAMRNVIYNYYKTIFTSGPPSDSGDFFGNIASRVTQVQNELLLRPFDASEVKSALFSMFPNKAPGPDGMNPGFYQHFWDVVGGDVSAYIVDCLNNRSFPARLNDTNIILIPKKKTPEMVSDYRPIALSNVVYRIMAKVITARMKPLMGGIISDTQSAFISDRLITDNILIAAEVGHFLNRKQCGITGWGALKLDMAKAYDRMEWPFLRSMMLALGFDERATAQEASVVKQCLAAYEEMSGQAVNYYKSSICYSKNTRDEQRGEVADILGVVQAPNFGKYLGLPSFVGRNRRAVFSYIDDKIRQRIGSWNKKLLSQAGKEVLLKSVAQSMPTFSMSVFLLPLNTCTAIERAMNRYWWRAKDDQGIHWKAWDKLCIPKKYGGLGFKELHAFNLAMLGKQAWRLLTKPETLVSKIYKARYYPKGTFFDASVGNNPSYCWRSIMAAQELVCGGVRRRIGNGKETLIWEHPWLQDDNNAEIITDKPPYLAQATVMGLIDQETATWDHEILNDIFIPEDVMRILKIPVSPDYEDMWYWHGDVTGEYSVKSGYRQVVGDYVHTTGMFDK
ncbi:PREDICTED: uncharacterized protein LOC109167042 [Ipomoea nil]|uniref:uncharacterized protein LOC109167042 n=1 Tax=Ipomoea nil TaxID=35883 RepID=UPI000901D1D1|nr:PREDICTED: uncharacterized protein LOC109167042 [Ipomoea nil]